MLFDEGIPPELLMALESLESAYAELNVPYPYDKAADMSVLHRIKSKYPDVNVADLVDGFLVWCCDTEPWHDDKGKATVIRWRSRLWTRANNEVRYGKKRRYKSRTHFNAEPISEDPETVEW